MKKTRIKRWIRALLLGALLFFVLIPAAGWFLLGRPWIQDRLVREVNRRFAETGPYPVRVEGLRGHPPLHLALARISLSDRSGVWMEIEDARARLSGWGLLIGRLRVHELSAGSATVLRWPEAPGGERATPRPEAGWRELPGHITLSRLSIPHLRLEPGLPGLPGGERIEFALEGRARASPNDGVSAMLHLFSRAPAPTRLHARVQWVGPGAPIRVWADLAEPADGWLGASLGKPFSGGFRFESEASFRPGFVHGALIFRSGMLGRGRAAWRAEEREVWEAEAEVHTRGLTLGPLQFDVPRLSLRATLERGAEQLAFDGTARSGPEYVTARGELYRAPRGIGVRDLHLAAGPSVLHGGLFWRTEDGLVEGRVEFADVHPAALPFVGAWIPAERTEIWSVTGTASGFLEADRVEEQQSVRAEIDVRNPSGPGFRAQELRIELQATGPWEAPEARMKAALHRIEGGVAEKIWPAGIDRLFAQAVLEGDRLTGEAEVDATGVHAEITLSTDGVLAALRARETEWFRHPGTGSLRIDARLEALPEGSVPAVEQLRGRLLLSLAGRGTLKAPDLDGRLEWANGRLWIPELGARLADIRVVVAGSDNRLEIEEAVATDGEGGRLSARGAVQLLALHLPPRIELDLESRSMRLLDVPMVSARVDGELSTRPSGDDGRHLLLGHLSARNAAVRLPSRLPPHIPDVRLVERGAPVEEPLTEDRMAAWLTRVDLDVGVRVRRLGVRGRGLSSTWSGRLQTEGTLADPRVVGTIEAERGRLQFLGRRFAIEAAALNWSGPVREPPALLFRATTRTGGARAWIEVQGTVHAPAITLRSDPPGPEDEVLARVLFGRSLDRLSPFQALRLAQGLRVLQGDGDTWDIMARGQHVLRVDQIDLVHDDEDADGAGAIAVGKYVGSVLYVEGAKGLGGAQDRVTAELELSPSFTLETEAAPGLREGIRLRWSRDY